MISLSTSAYWFRLQCLLMPRENRNLTELMVRKDYLLSLVSFLGLVNIAVRDDRGEGISSHLGTRCQGGS